MNKTFFFKTIWVFWTVSLFILGWQHWAGACTLWAAAGKTAAAGGTLIAKNRDWIPDQTQKIELVREKDGYQFIGLYAVNGKDAGLKAGVNEAGLVVVNAAAPGGGLHYHHHHPDLMTRLLKQCRDIPDVLRHGDWLRGPRFLLLADRQRITSVEIGPQGIYRVKTLTNNTLAHTNHYLEPDMRLLNPVPLNDSSRLRYQAIQKYLASQKSFRLEDFIKVSQSRQNGPDNSLWRTGGTPDAERTLATWVVSQPAVGKPTLFVRLANPDQAVKEFSFDLQQTFKRQVLVPEAKRRFILF